MQILSEKYMFAESVEAENGMDEAKELTYQMVEQMAVSPAVKRQIWQTFLVVKELSKVLDNPPKRVFIEMAREKMESKRTISRKQKLMELYKKCREEERDWLQELNDTKDFGGINYFCIIRKKGVVCIQANRFAWQICGTTRNMILTIFIRNQK